MIADPCFICNSNLVQVVQGVSWVLIRLTHTNYRQHACISSRKQLPGPIVRPMLLAMAVLLACLQLTRLRSHLGSKIVLGMWLQVAELDQPNSVLTISSCL